MGTVQITVFLEITALNFQGFTVGLTPFAERRLESWNPRLTEGMCALIWGRTVGQGGIVEL